MLFNARQAAYEFGFLTLPEFAEATLGTLNSFDQLEKQRGHIYNWYDIETLRPQVLELRKLNVRNQLELEQFIGKLTLE